MAGAVRRRRGGDDRTGLARWGLRVLVDLADPTRAPIVLPAPVFTSGRWGPDGRYALFCTDSTQPPNCGQPMGTQPHQEAGAVRVFDPDRGLDSEIIVPEVQTFGGGPEIAWTADGSGFLGRHGTEWGVTPLDGGPFRPGAPRILSRETDPSRPDFEHLLGSAVPTGDSELDYLDVVAAQLAADGEAVWKLFDRAIRGHKLGPSPRALLVRLTGPGTVESGRSYALPAEPNCALPAEPNWFTLSPDDVFVAFHIGGDDQGERFVLVSVYPEDAPAEPGPVIDGSLAGLVPAAIADAWFGR